MASRRTNYSQYQYTSTARKLEPAYEPQRKSRIRVSPHIRANRERAGRMSVGYAVFLIASIVFMAFMCTQYLGMQSEITNRTKEITKLECQLNDLKLANDEEYARIMGAVDLEEIKQIAMDDLKMTYPTESQIMAFTDNDSDYVRQYGDIPQ